MSDTDIEDFVEHYTTADERCVRLDAIEGPDSEVGDRNAPFRHRVLEYVSAHPAVGPVSLLSAVFRAECEYSGVAWCAHADLPLLGWLLLLRGGTDVVLEFLRAEEETNPTEELLVRIDLPRERVDELVRFCAATQVAAPDEETKSLAAAGVARLDSLRYRYQFGRDDSSQWIVYAEGHESIRVEWAFCGEPPPALGDARRAYRTDEPVAEILLPSEEAWERETAWRRERRPEIAARIAFELNQVIPCPCRHEPATDRLLFVQVDYDRIWFDQLDVGDSAQNCAEPACGRAVVRFSVRCRVHHFESIKKRPCPYADRAPEG